ncbi:MAG: hypothetical protein R6W68_03095 [Ignavibacteriaceae bacterium]
MAKVLFTIQYDIQPEMKHEYLKVIREMKNVLTKEEIESYNVYEMKGKSNSFQEVYTFSSLELYEAFDDSEDERLNILITKISDMTVENTTKYSTLIELVD